MRVGVIVLLLLPALTGAQAPAGLDVVSVRLHASSSDESDLFSGGTRILPGRLIARRVSLEDLAALAHGIPSGIAPAARRLLIQGWPTAQMAEARFDVEATLRPADADLSLDEWRPFVLDILRSRFGLQTHTERRRVRAYALRLIEPGRLGPALRQRTEPAVMNQVIVAEARNVCQTGCV
jgi:uncharacterized protein (TIGR03435 family)